MRAHAGSLVVLAVLAVPVAGCPIYAIRPTTRTVTPTGPVTGNPTGVVTGTAPRPVQVHLVNDTGAEICYLHVSPASDTQWGEDRLGEQTLPQGAALRVQLDARYPAWDVLAQDCARVTLVELRDQPLPADGNLFLRTAVVPPTPPPVDLPPQPVQVRLVNESGLEICFLMVSEVGAPWGDDRLGADQTIPAGEEVILELDANLMWDYKAEDCTHTSITEQYNVRVFEGAVWAIHNTHGAGAAAGGAGYVESAPSPAPEPAVASGPAINRRLAVAAGFFLGASPGDVEDLLDGDCGFIDNGDLADFCRGDCGFIDNGDVADLCRGDCSFIDNGDLADLCRGDCGFIDDSDLADFCRGDCSFIDDAQLADACRAI
jgi:hypothetical protein